MNNKNELKIKLKELEANLKNHNVQKELESQNLNLDDLKQTIHFYLEKIEQFDDEDFKSILTKVNELVSHSNQSAFSVYSHKFINTARYLMDNRPVVDLGVDDNLNIQDNTKISEEEFLNRCEKLIEQLGYEYEDPKLILKTQVDEKEFRVFKNKNKSIIYFAENSKNGMPISLDNLKEIAFKRKESNRKSYDSVIIAKIFDNTIFNEINKTFDAQLNESLINQIRKHSEELFKLKDNLEVIQKDKEDFNTAKTELNEILSKSTTAQQEFQSAKNAAVDYSKLNASVSYWQTKQAKHIKKFWYFIGGAILLIFLLVGLLFMALNYHNNQINESKKIEIINKINTTTETKKIIEDSNKSINLIRQNQLEPKQTISNNKEETKIFDFDYSKLAWYILMIFASSSAFWIIRITVKIALSNLHLSEDAHERVVMIQTYLSFVKEGQIDENDKNLILSSLFRPSNIGIIKDESSVTVADIITAFKK